MPVAEGCRQKGVFGTKKNNGKKFYPIALGKQWYI
jgi:hypothetical protein